MSPQDLLHRLSVGPCDIPYKDPINNTRSDQPIARVQNKGVQDCPNSKACCLWRTVIWATGSSAAISKGLEVLRLLVSVRTVIISQRKPSN